VGTELLLGQIVDTNSAYLAQQLARLGIDLHHKTTVGDNLGRLTAALREGLARADVIILTGGLGPTQDDLTGQGIADAVGEDLVLDEPSAERIRARFAARGLPLQDSHFRQARLPRSAQAIPNPVGTAPGILLERDGRAIIAMPGVPAEMVAMFEESVIPYLRKRAGGDRVIESRVLQFSGIGESFLEARLLDLIEKQTNPTIAPLAKTGEVHLRITASAPDVDTARAMIAEVEKEVRARVGEHLFAVDETRLEALVGQELRAAGRTLAVAESCTGGLIGSRLTEVPGSSDYFLGGVVTYADAAKRALLGVSPETLAAHGAVSEETARAMAAGVRQVLGADFGLAVTGVAGPTGGTPEKPVGLAYLALAGPDGVACERHSLFGDRQGIRHRASQAALFLLHRTLARAEQTAPKG
jgi:nicotinamide-nucleotide amidase